MNARIVDAILVLVAIEMVGMVWYRRRRKRGMPTPEVISFLGAGAGLLIALRVLVADGSFAAFGCAMLVSLGMHLWHVKQRWQ